MKRPGAWKEKLLDEIASHPRVLVVLDFDGTLVPMRARPHLATLGADERATLRRLDRGRARVAMISGRSVADLRERISVPDLLYGGVFGLEIAGPGWRYVHPKARRMQQALADLVEGLGKLFADVPGVLVEDKGVGLCVHYRNVPGSRRKEFARRLAHAHAASPGGLRWRRGRLSWEVMPRTNWDKGDAAKLIWRRLDRPFMVVVGDERFDEPMLRAAHDRGAGLRVGRGSTEARHRLRDSNAVRRFLRGLAERVSRRPPNPRYDRRLRQRGAGPAARSRIRS
jgi:trehalose 6-phosphate phosphatase